MIGLDRNDKLLIIAPHPDDEIIGCGGLIQKVKNAGGKVYVLFLTVGPTRDFSIKGFSESQDRKKEIEKVASFLKYDGYSIVFEGEDYHLLLDKFGQKNLMDVIERDNDMSLENILPTIVAFPSVTSYNQDHRIAAHAALAALRPSDKKHKHFVPTVICYEEAADGWSTEPSVPPNLFLPLSEIQIQKKITALKYYKSQYRNRPNPRSTDVLLALSELRGSMCGTDFAEAFFTYRLVL